MTLVSHDKSGKSCSQAELFDLICEREGVQKCLFLYQQRGFAKLGRSAAALVEAYPMLTKLIDEISVTNQLTEDCMLYLSSEFFYTELEALAYFNLTVTFLFLHHVEISLREELLKILPKLHQDLLEGKTDILKDFAVDIWRVPMKEPSHEVGRKITNMIFHEAAKGVKLQCGREYGFDNTTTDVRATILSDLDKAELKGLTTNNLTAERKLAIYDKHAGKVGKCRN